jgi:hypothetical protein
MSTRRLSRSARWFLVSLAVVVACLSTGCLSAAAQSPERSAGQPAGAAFGIQPASAKGPDARQDFTYSATPGARVADHVAVVNLGTAPVTLRLYASDATSTANGSFTLQPAATKPTDLGAWVHLDGPSSVTVPARTAHGPSSVIVPFTVAVPANASPGDHAGGVLVSLDGSVRNKQGVDVQLDQRVGVRVYLRVAGPVHATLQVEGLRLGYAAPSVLGSPFARGTLTVTYRIHNTGNVILGATQALTIQSPLGATIHVRGLALVPPLLPGAEVSVSRRVAGVFPGLRITAKVALSVVVPPGAADHDVVSSHASATIWAVPWLLAVLCVLLIVGLAGFGWWWTIRRRGPGPLPPASRASHRRGAARRRNTVGHRSSEAKRLIRLSSAAVAVALLGMSLFTAGPASAAALPADPNAVAALGFCDSSGHSVTGGSIDATPFVIRAVGAMPAPPAYAVAGRTATLYGYQPRVGVPAGAWSGEFLTASSRYTNPTYPTAVGTALDPSLADFLGDFPAREDGLIQVRMYLGAPDTPIYSQRYSAAELRITGSTWKLVSGGGVPCNQGQATSIETIYLPSSEVNPPSSAHSAHSSGDHSPAPVAGSSTAPAAPTPDARGLSAATRTPGSPAVAASNTSSGGGGSPVLAVVGVVAVLLVAGGGGLWWWRRIR